MNDEYVNKGQVIMLTAWAVVIGLMVIGWALILWTSHVAWGGMFAAMACATSALAATLQIRCYAVRMMCLVRATSSLGPAGGFDGPRSVRDL